MKIKMIKATDMIIRSITFIISSLFLLFGSFTVWDMYRTGGDLMIRDDLKRYSPRITDDPPYLEELLKINPDTVGWITINGTKIDYPIVQGRTDMEYINRDVYGGYSMAGSIFLSVLNRKDMDEPYHLLYGHHMENGSMFGDLDRFTDPDFFYNKDEIRTEGSEGSLTLPDKTLCLTVFALLKTDAYDEMIYRADKSEEDVAELLKYAEKNALLYRDIPDIDQVLSLSTCDSSTSYGRTILLLKVSRSREEG